jgi:hypothetical protein
MSAYDVRVCIERRHTCQHCNGEGRIPGGRYKSEGEVVTCPLCKGNPWRRDSVTLSELYDLLHGNLPHGEAGAGAKDNQ